jgi:alpha-tubulin suppressor-like RCC1 family protein
MPMSPANAAVTARAVYANGNQGFYEDAQGRLLGWGQNGNGNLGIPDDEDQPAPTSPVFGLASVLDAAIGALQGFAMRGDQVFGWGWSFHGSLGAGPSAIHTWPYRTPLLVQLP